MKRYREVVSPAVRVPAPSAAGRLEPFGLGAGYFEMSEPVDRRHRRNLRACPARTPWRRISGSRCGWAPASGKFVARVAAEEAARTACAAGSPEGEPRPPSCGRSASTRLDGVGRARPRRPWPSSARARSVTWSGSSGRERLRGGLWAPTACASSPWPRGGDGARCAPRSSPQEPEPGGDPAGEDGGGGWISAC